MSRFEYGEAKPGMLYADLHIHGEADDGRLTIERMVRQAQKARLTAIGVTLHDNYSFGYDVKNFVARNNIPLIVYAGKEDTALGIDGEDVHLLVYETDGDIKPYQSIYNTYNEAVKKGGFVVFPHPDSSVEGSGKFDEVIDLDIPIHVEVFNAGVRDMYRLNRLLGRGGIDSNKTTLEKYEKYKDQLGAAVGSTDAHRFKLGQGKTGYEFDLRQSLEQKTTIVREGGIELWSIRDKNIHDSKLKLLNAWRDTTYPRPNDGYEEMLPNPIMEPLIAGNLV